MSDPAHPEQGRPRTVRVLECDPDLGADLDRAERARATRELVAPVFDVTWKSTTARWGFEGTRARLGLRIVDGLVVREVRMLGTSSAELLGAGDLLRPADVDGEAALPVRADVCWTALAPLRVAALDGAFLTAACRYPAVLGRVTARAIARSKSLALHDTVTNLKHVETRLLVEFWHLADRWGRVSPDGVTVTLPLTHGLLGKLVGAARPSVTTALGNLAARGLLTRDGSCWRLSHESRHALAKAHLRGAAAAAP
jgi:CRP/FNR family cyclic AMP-dependent transcriptional regulator